MTSPLQPGGWGGGVPKSRGTTLTWGLETLCYRQNNRATYLDNSFQQVYIFPSTHFKTYRYSSVWMRFWYKSILKGKREHYPWMIISVVYINIFLTYEGSWRLRRMGLSLVVQLEKVRVGHYPFKRLNCYLPRPCLTESRGERKTNREATNREIYILCIQEGKENVF